jgi:hypothetical protein
MRWGAEQFPRNLFASSGITAIESDEQPSLERTGGIMYQNFQGLPAASSVEQSIILAQLLILRASGNRQR